LIVEQGITMRAAFGPLHEWHDFYALVGTASATLIGLMFVAVSIAEPLAALVAQTEQSDGPLDRCSLAHHLR
jgi:hypothetical protein